MGQSGSMIIGRRIAALLVAAVAVAGCATTVAGSPAPEGAAPAAAGSGRQAPPSTPARCSSPTRSRSSSGRTTAARARRASRSVCTWTTADELSVTVDVAQPGTAVNGLPAWEPALGPERPLPDGMRSLSGGQVEFVAGTRDCAVQVVTDPTDRATSRRRSRWPRSSSRGSDAGPPRGGPAQQVSGNGCGGSGRSPSRSPSAADHRGQRLITGAPAVSRRSIASISLFIGAVEAAAGRGAVAGAVAAAAAPTGGAGRGRGTRGRGRRCRRGHRGGHLRMPNPRRSPRLLRRGRVACLQLRRHARRELTDDLVGDVGDHTAAELRGPPGDLHVGDHRDGGLVRPVRGHRCR